MIVGLSFTSFSNMLNDCLFKNQMILTGQIHLFPVFFVSPFSAFSARPAGHYFGDHITFFESLISLLLCITKVRKLMELGVPNIPDYVD